MGRRRTDTRPGRMERLTIALYEREYIEVNDVVMQQQWTAALGEVGYQFPAACRGAVCVDEFVYGMIACVHKNCVHLRIRLCDGNRLVGFQSIPYKIYSKILSCGTRRQPQAKMHPT